MASISPFGTNNHGVRTTYLDFSAPGAPSTKVYHGITIVVEGKIVGRIQSWNTTSYARNGQHVYELSHATYGRAVDYVPSIATGYSISFERTEVWNQELEIALGYPGIWSDLVDQNKPFTVQEFLFKGPTPYRIWEYSGCWFTEKNEGGFQAQGDATIQVSGNLAFVRKAKVL